MKKTVLFVMILSALIVGGIYILYNVFNDVKNGVIETETQKTENNTEKEVGLFEGETNLEENEENTATSTIVDTNSEIVVQNNTTQAPKTVVKTTTTETKTTVKKLQPVVTASLTSCPDGMSLQCWDNLSCYENGKGYGSPALWTANSLTELPPACGQWAVDDSKLPTNWSCCCGYNDDWQEAGGGKKCYSPVYTSNLTYQ